MSKNLEKSKTRPFSVLNNAVIFRCVTDDISLTLLRLVVPTVWTDQPAFQRGG
jgi:hypothetical protein